MDVHPSKYEKSSLHLIHPKYQIHPSSVACANPTTFQVFSNLSVSGHVALARPSQLDPMLFEGVAGFYLAQPLKMYQKSQVLYSVPSKKGPSIQPYGWCDDHRLCKSSPSISPKAAELANSADLFALHLPRHEGISGTGCDSAFWKRSSRPPVKTTAASQSFMPFKYSRLPIWLGSTRASPSTYVCVEKRWGWGHQILDSLKSVNHRPPAMEVHSFLPRCVEPPQIRLQS